MSTHKTVTVIPPCDICHHVEHRTTPNPAWWDLKTIQGPWANVCYDHSDWALFREVGGTPSLGTGKGQRLLLPGESLEDVDS